MIYRILQWLLTVATRVFFRRIEVVGLDNVPTDGGVLFCGNHPNSLLDPILITAHCGRRVSFAAKDTLFDSFILGFLLRRMGAVPVRRRRDHKDGKLDNDEAFAALHDVLIGGGSVGIFPEGLSHLDSQLAPLKTGAARIALDAARKGGDTPVHVVPTGLVYSTRHRFRSSVLIQFGAPIVLRGTDLDDTDNEEVRRSQVRRLTDNLDRRMRALTINADTWGTIRVLDGVRRMYQPDDLSLEDRVELARRFNTVYPQVAHHDDVKSLYTRVRGYVRRMEAMGLSDTQLRSPTSLRQTVAKVIGHLVLLLFWAPLSFIGAPLHIPLAVLFRLVGKRVSPRKDTVATTKFVLGFLTMLLVYAGIAATVGWQLGVWAAVGAAILLPLSGWALIHVLARLEALRHTFLTLMRLFRLRREVAELRKERAQLVALVCGAVDRYRPDDMDPIVKREESIT